MNANPLHGARTRTRTSLNQIQRVFAVNRPVEHLLCKTSFVPVIALSLLFAPMLSAESLRMEASVEAMGSAYSIVAYGEDRYELQAAVDLELLGRDLQVRRDVRTRLEAGCRQDAGRERCR